jgi:hypothetical protein
VRQTRHHVIFFVVVKKKSAKLEANLCGRPYACTRQWSGASRS